MQKMQEMWVWSLGREGPLEYKMATPPQYSCLENSMDRGAWWAIVHGVVKSWTWLSTLACTYACKFLLIEIYILINIKQHISSVQFSHPVMCNSLQSHGLQHTMLPCPSPIPGACSNSCPLSQWWYPTISSSVVPFSSCLQFFPASGSFPGSQFFISGGQSIGASALASVLPMNIQGWYPLGWTGWISLLSRGLQESPPTPQFKRINFLVLSFLYGPTLTS